jgi:ubiquitin C-terminal hydrolase
VAFEEDIAICVDGEETERRKNEEAVDDGEDYTPKYRLMSVITHKGWHDGGHYICYRRRKREKKHKKSHGEEKGSITINTEEKGKDVRHSMEEVADSDESLENVEKGIVGSGLKTAGIEQVDSRTKWWETSDEVVVGVHKDDVLAKRKGVYILFYERKL